MTFTTVAAAVPLDYTTPPFPSLYWPINNSPGSAKYLYNISDIWRFTLYWTLITFFLTHLLTSLWAVLMQLHSAVLLHRQKSKSKSSKSNSRSNPNTDSSSSSSSSIRPSTGTSSEPTLLPQPLLTSPNPIMSTLGWVWIIPLVYLAVGGLEALLSGGLVGLVAGAVYNAGNFKMSTWMPFLWGMINCLVVILGSFRLQGGL